MYFVNSNFGRHPFKQDPSSIFRFASEAPWNDHDDNNRIYNKHRQQHDDCGNVNMMSMKFKSRLPSWWKSLHHNSPSAFSAHNTLTLGHVSQNWDWSGRFETAKKIEMEMSQSIFGFKQIVFGVQNSLWKVEFCALSGRNTPLRIRPSTDLLIVCLHRVASKTRGASEPLRKQ